MQTCCRLIIAGVVIVTAQWVLIAAEPTPKSKPNIDIKSSSTANADGKSEKWTSLFDGKALDGWKVPNFGPQGEVEVKDKQIILNYGDGLTGITWTKQFPKTNYEIAVEAMRVDGNDFFCGLTFPVGDDPCSFIVGGWGGTVVGLSSIDDRDASDNNTSKGKEFKTKQWYDIRVRVTKDSIQAWIDDEQMVDQERKDHKISIRPEVELSKPLGITSWKTTAAIRSIKYRELKPEKQ